MTSRSTGYRLCCLGVVLPLTAISTRGGAAYGTGAPHMLSTSPQQQQAACTHAHPGGVFTGLQQALIAEGHHVDVHCAQMPLEKYAMLQLSLVAAGRADQPGSSSGKELESIWTEARLTMHDIPQRSRHWVGEGRVIMTSFVDQALARSHQPGHRVQTHSQLGGNRWPLYATWSYKQPTGAPIILAVRPCTTILA